MTTAVAAIKETGTVFSREMNGAVLIDKKLVTRRLKGLQEINQKPEAWHYEGQNINDDFLFYNTHARAVGCEPPDCMKVVKCPYGRIGDRLYIRETYAVKSSNESLTNPACWYSVDFETPRQAAKALGIKWIGGIYMPKRCARTFLEIVDIRVERVQEVSAEQALAEGVSESSLWKPKEVDENPKPTHEWKAPFWDDFYFWSNYPQMVFEKLWKKLNGDKSWQDNPYVWVIEFKRILTN